MKRMVTLCCILAILLVGCGNSSPSSQPEQEQSSVSPSSSQPEAFPSETPNEPPVTPANGTSVSLDRAPLAAWIAYWDMEVVDELKKLQNQLDTLVYFECFYDARDALYLPDQLKTMISYLNEAFPNPGWDRYLSFVNDIIFDDQSTTLKDVELLRRIFASEETMKQQIGQMLALTKELGFEGIEIDFENMKKDVTLWQDYATFCGLLQQEAAKQGIPVRIVLCPDAPLEKVTFPDGPAYVVMCYNLYGYHSGPGPKADKAFLEGLARSYSGLSNLEYALATGGFDWTEDGTITALTEAEAVALIKVYSGAVKRDPDSGVLHFSYLKERKRHTVYYADQRTFELWYEALQAVDARATIPVSIWRLGGNLYSAWPA